jgi:hypothetical protein
MRFMIWTGFLRSVILFDSIDNCLNLHPFNFFLFSDESTPLYILLEVNKHDTPLYVYHIAWTDKKIIEENLPF